MKWIVAVIMGISFYSCITYPSMHYSVAQNVPLLTQKGDVRFSAATGTEAIGLQTAYAFSKSWAVMGSYSGGLDEFSPPGLIYDGGFNNGSRRSGELAIGYFEAIDAKGVFEIYGGMERYYRSYSTISTVEANPHESALSTNCNKPFVQVDVGFHNMGKHSFGLSLKLGLLTYDHFSYMMPDSSGKPVSVPYNFDLSPALVVEPCLTYRLGSKNLSFQAQAGFSFSGSSVNSINSGSSFSEPFFFNAGLAWRMVR